jgi:hypothetical protein
VFRPPRFALKGGAELNLFVQDMPGLSVDIDVVFTDHTLNRKIDRGGPLAAAIGTVRR